MKIPSILTATTIAFSMLLPIHALATTPEKLECTAMGNNTQCDYKVYGEDSSQPNEVSKLYLNTNMPYALCSNAKCTIDKNNPKMSQCACTVYGINKDQDAWQKASVGPLAYDAAKPIVTSGKITTITSTYSAANLTSFSNKTSVECDFSKTTAWANCFGAKCTVDTSGNTAICQCPIIRSKSFVSVGPEFKSDCQLPEGQAWSAATKAQDNNNSSIMSDFYEKNFRQNYKFK